MKTTRFATVVETAGAPSTYLLWVPPEKDEVLQRAIKEHRVMTVHQDVRGTRKDHGTVGFAREPEAQYLVFPKSLRRFETSRIVGINYELLTNEASLPSAAAVSAATSKRQGGATTKVPPKLAGRPPVEPKREAAARPRGSGKSDDAAASPAAPAPTAAATARPPRRPTQWPARSSPTPPAAPADRVDLPRTIRELRRAVRDLKSGRAVPAYERLQALLEQLETPPTGQGKLLRS